MFAFNYVYSHNSLTPSEMISAIVIGVVIGLVIMYFAWKISKIRTVQYIVGTKVCERALACDDAHKSALYHVFFGWRRTFTFLNLEIMEFRFTDKEIELIEREN